MDLSAEAPAWDDCDVSVIATTVLLIEFILPFIKLLISLYKI